MNTTGLVTTVTDELLADLDLSVRAVWHDDDAAVIAVDALTAELRRLRAENAELERQNGLLTTAVSDVWKLKEGKIKSACLSQAGDATNWQAEEISRLNIENAELEKDAGRYRHIVKYLSHWGAGVGRGVCMPSDYSSSTKEQCDASIDTAMAAQ